MSLTSALSNALSGLNTGARLAEIASENISNALTEGFARRQAQIASRQIGGIGAGVRIVSVERQISQAIVQDLRLANSIRSSIDPRLVALRSIETAFGDPTDASSLTAWLSSFQRSLTEAAARPDSSARLLNVKDAAKNLVASLNSASEAIAGSRQVADTAIERNVKTLNTAIRSVKDLNTQIAAMTARGQDTSSAEDRRQTLIDQIAEIVPVREVARQGNQVALFSTSGLALLDGRAAVFSFSPTRAIQPDMTVESGGLSGLAVDGKPISTGPEGGHLGQGRLSAHFQIRDEDSVRQQRLVDDIAKSLIERLSGPDVDPSLAAGEAGLFVDQDGTDISADAPGWASRITLNIVIADGSEESIWRIRDGIHATADPARSDPTLLQNFAQRLAEERPVPASANQGAFSLFKLAAEAASTFAVQRLEAETNLSFSQARTEALKGDLLRDGVDSDREMQDLMQIEKAYAANAKVIQSVDDMLRAILEI
ncbi:flagellar hook-associated protein FlgK [Thioclava sp. FR2]|uniref:flagellar hook-associated protein FlgK n=1 Tax=Thioclava sp. FR2 TaxID=3445780 RepID=UPI003EC0FFE9